MKVGDRVRTPLGFTGVITGFFETTYPGAHVRLDPSDDPGVYVPETGPYPLSVLLPIDEETKDDDAEF